MLPNIGLSTVGNVEFLIMDTLDSFFEMNNPHIALEFGYCILPVRSGSGRWIEVQT